MSSRGWRFNIWRQRRHVRHCALFVHLQFGRLVQESCGNLGVRCCFSQPKQDRRLTHEVLFTDHFNFPVVSQRRRDYSEIGAFVPIRTYKSELRGFSATFGSAPRVANTGTGEPEQKELSPVWNCWNSRVPLRRGCVPIRGTAPADCPHAGAVSARTSAGPCALRKPEAQRGQ